MKKRIVSYLMALAFVMGGFPGSAWAGESSLCPHHTAHTEECCPDGTGEPPCSCVCGICSVEAVIDGLPEAEKASNADYEAVLGAWDAWEALSPEEQARVGNLAKLKSLLAFYSEQTMSLQEEALTLYLEDGDISIIEGWCMQDQKPVPHTGDYIITQRDPETPVESTVMVFPDTGSTINITIRDVNIDVSDSGRAAISISNGGKVVLTLEGTNRVISGENYAGIMTGGDINNELTIQGSGSLEARGGGYGAGIGGALDSEMGTIRIESGTIAAYGGKGAAGIGGGDTVKAGGSTGGGAGTIVISGGTVYAEGTENPEETNEDSAYGAAGIGGGYSGGSSTIKILGGDVTAVGAAKAPCIGNANISHITISGGMVRTQRKPDDGVQDAHDIGGYQDFCFADPASLDSGENGRAIIYVSGPDRISKWSAIRETWNGIVWEGDDGVVYGTVDLSESGLTIGAGQTLEVPGSSDPASEPVLIITADGFHNSGTITGTGLVMVDGEKYRIEDNRFVSLTPEPPEIEVSITGDPSKTYDGTAAVLPESGYTVTGSDAAVSVLYKTKNAPDSAYTASAPVNAGEYVVKVACEGVDAEKGFTISQAVPAAAVIPVSVQYDGAAEQTVDLSAVIDPYLLPEDVPAYTVGSLPENSFLSADAVHVSGKIFSFALASGVEISGGEAVVDIPIIVSGFTNYAPLALTVHITVTSGTPSEKPDPPYWEGPTDGGGRPNESRPSPDVSTPKPGDSTETAPQDKITTTEHPDGSKVIEVKRADGSASTTVVSASGQIVTTVELAENAAEQSGVIKLPMPSVPSVRDAAQAPSVTVNGPEGAIVTVEIPVENAAPGTVAAAIGPDGTRKVLRQTVPSENGVVISIPTGTTVQILDNSKAFADVPAEHWGRDAVDFVTSRELFSGTDAVTFSPDQGMTRGMLMTVLARLDGVDTAGGQNWYEKGVAWAVTHGVSSGEDPGLAVTCEQMVTMLHRYAGSPPAAGSLSGFPTDAYSVSDYAVNAVNWALENGLLTDADGGLMVPKSMATRVQGAMILMRFVERAG